MSANAMETPDPSALNDVLSALQLLPDARPPGGIEGGEAWGRLSEGRLGEGGEQRGRELTLAWQAERALAALSLEEAPLISIVTPSLNHGRFLERTLRSVLEQDYPRLELLVIDGGSTDETVVILEEYRARYPGVFDFVSEKDRGQAHAINKGFARARGEVVGWLNSDDTYEPGCLDRVARAFVEDPESDLVYGHGMYVAEDDRPISVYPTRSAFDWQALAYECYICQPSVFWRRRLLERGFRLDEALDLCMDYDFWIRLGREAKIRFVDQHLANSRLHGDAKTVRHRSRIFDEVFATVRRHYGFVPVSWVLGKAHHECDRADPLVNVRRPTWKTYLTAFWLALTHNAVRPRFWPKLVREGAGILRHKLRKEWAVFSSRARARGETA